MVPDVYNFILIFENVTLLHNMAPLTDFNNTLTHAYLKKKTRGLLASQVSQSVCNYMPVLITIGGDKCFQSYYLRC